MQFKYTILLCLTFYSAILLCLTQFILLPLLSDKCNKYKKQIAHLYAQDCVASYVHGEKTSTAHKMIKRGLLVIPQENFEI